MPTLEPLENNGYIRQITPELMSTRGRMPDVMIMVNPMIHAA